jgi:hypothetical protein
VAAAERFLPDPDLTVIELALVEADAARTYAAIDDADVSGDRLLGVLGGLMDLDKRLGGSPVRPKKLGELLGPELGFVSLADEPGSLRAVGLAARYSPFHRGVERLDPGAFGTFDEPGHVKAAIAFALHPQDDGHTLLTCDVRVGATDEDTRSTLHTTEFVVGPALRHLCRRLLELVKQQAESGSDGAQGAEGGDGDRDQGDARDLDAG